MIKGRCTDPYNSRMIFSHRAPPFDCLPQTLPLQLTRPRLPYGTQKVLLSAAPFPT